MNIATSNLLGNGLAFNGVNQTVTLPDIPHFTTLAPFSIALTLTHKNLDGLTRIVWGVFGAAFNGGKNIFQQGNFLSFTFYGISQVIASNYDISAFANQTIQIHYTFSVGTGLRLYINGLLVQSSAGGWTLDTGIINSPTKFGNAGSFGYDFNLSTLYRFIIFNKELSAAEVLQLGSSFNSNLTGLEPNVLVNYDFNHKRGNLLLDKSIHQRHGSLVNYPNTELGTNNSWRNSLGGAITL